MSTLARDLAVALCRAQVLAFLSGATTARRDAAGGLPGVTIGVRF